MKLNLTNNQFPYLTKNFPGIDFRKISPLIQNDGIASIKYIESMYNKYTMKRIELKLKGDDEDDHRFVIMKSIEDPIINRVIKIFNDRMMKQVWEFYFKRAPKLKLLLDPYTIFESAGDTLPYIIKIVKNINIKTLINSVKKFKITDDSSVHDVRGVIMASIINSHTHDIKDLCEIYDNVGVVNLLNGETDTLDLVKKIINLLPSKEIGRFSKTIVKFMFNSESSIWKDGTIYLLDNTENIISTLESLTMETKPSEERFKGIAVEFSRWSGYDQDDQDKAERWMEMSLDRKYTSIPYINIENNGYVMYRLSEDDPRALTLGEHTDCCQYIGGAGNSCVKYGMTQPNAGFYVIEKKGGNRIQSQAFVWRYEDTLVFDNVESLGGGRFKDMWKKAAKEIVKQHSLCIKSVIVGMGHNDEFTGKDGNVKNTPTEMLKVLDGCYTDARIHIILK